MTNQEKVDFKNKLRMKSFGNQTISDNSLLDIGNGIILYPLEGNLIIFDCNIYREIKKSLRIFRLLRLSFFTSDSDLPHLDKEVMVSTRRRRYKVFCFPKLSYHLLPVKRIKTVHAPF
jgi:hypothetical protein